MVCPHCGETIPDGVTYCNECGGDVNAAPATPSPRSSSPQAAGTARNSARRMSEADEKAQNTSLGIAVVIGVALIAVICGIIAIILLSAH